MANQVTIKQSPELQGTFLASVFNEQGTPVPNVWQEFNLAKEMVWDPTKYGAKVTPFYIAKGIGPDPNNQFVAYEVLVKFNTATENAVVTLGIAQVTNPDGGAGCNYFTAHGEGVAVEVIKTGVPVAGTELPARCS
ncbi:MAG: hypothetical protein HRT68_07670 [Flavobacteriaceae bacterium]|nr:hypothetical protein [Flavobacteriaceae bacterium]